MTIALYLALISLDLTREKLLEGVSIPERREFKLSERVRPCDNFYDYVCDDVRSHFKLPADRSRWVFSFMDSAERLLYAKKKFFEALRSGYTPKHEHARPVKDFYLACMNESKSKDEEPKFVEREKTAILGIKTRKEFAQLAEARLDSPGASFLGWDRVPNQMDPTRFDVLLMSRLMTFPEKSYYENPEALKDLEALARDFFEAIEVDHAADRAKDVVQFERAAAQAALTPAEMRPRFSANTYRTATELLKDYPHLMLDRFLKKIPQNLKIRDFVPESMKFFEGALQNYNLEAMKSALLFASAQPFMDDAYPDFYKKRYSFDQKYFASPAQRPDRQERCTKEAMNKFGMEIDEELISILFPNFPQERVVKLAENVRASILRGLQRNAWLSETARKEAIRKIKTAKLFLVKPSRETDWDFMPEASYKADAPYSNRELYERKGFEKAFKEVSEIRNPKRWDASPLTLNAFYNPPDNKFVLLQGILQYPFYDPSMSEIENIGAIGTVVGHELGHSIDDQGSRFDADGRVRQWMTAKDLEAFSKRTVILVDQFNGIHHNGKLTLGENIGDHVGLGFSYDAAFPHAKRNLEEQKKFFIAYARLWCTVATSEAEQLQLKTDPHSLGEARVNEQLKHHPGFYEAYQCKEGDGMYRSEKTRVKVW